jgi:putative N6-adenine-specific DNA methylase
VENKDIKFKMVAKTFRGLEDVLYNELESLGAKDLIKGNRMVEFIGNQEMMYRANFHLRTALKILKPIKEFKVKNEHELYKSIQTIDWSKYFDLKGTFAVDSVVFSNNFSHTKYVALKVKDAIVDQFREKFGKRPYVDVDDPDLRINIHISNETCTVLLDSSGESLHKRGYRIRTNKAPLNEVLAAGMILLSGWDKKSLFIDPMCGSGTLVIEAAMMAHNVAPGIYRNKFGFETWKDFNSDLLEEIYEEESPENKIDINIIGADISEIATRITSENLDNAALKRKVDLITKPIKDFIPPKDQPGTIITNPPYGERLKKNEIDNFYKELGDKFKKSFKGYNIWLISSNFGAIKHIGLHPTKKMTLYNGALECKFLNYEIYEGSKKYKEK